MSRCCTNFARGRQEGIRENDGTWRLRRPAFVHPETPSSLAAVLFSAARTYICMRILIVVFRPWTRRHDSSMAETAYTTASRTLISFDMDGKVFLEKPPIAFSLLIQVSANTRRYGGPHYLNGRSAKGTPPQLLINQQGFPIQAVMTFFSRRHARLPRPVPYISSVGQQPPPIQR